MIDKEKAEVYAILADVAVKFFRGLGDVICKFVCVIVGLGLLVTNFVLMIKASPWQAQGVFGAVEMMLGHTAYKVFAHFFPSSKSDSPRVTPPATPAQIGHADELED